MMSKLIEAFRDILSDKEIVECHVWSQVASGISIRRMEMDMTEEELAGRVGTTARTIRRIENCDYDARLSLLAKIIAELWCDETMAAILEESDGKDPE